MKISTPEAMYEYWNKLSKNNNILLLYWELGAGKTTLIKWFATWLWIDPEKVQSPTYAYINIYDDKLLHIDMYRLNSFEDLVEKGILNQISEYEYIVIEWPKREDKLDISNALKIEIKKISAEVREVEIK